MDFICIKGRLHEKAVLSVMSQSQYMPTEEKLRAKSDIYEADESVFPYAITDGTNIAGIIILRRMSPAGYEIMSIAVDTPYRGRRIGTDLIALSAKELSCHELCAETDDDAVEFYRKRGFDIISLGEKYPGVVRYLCKLKL
ncbi:MAG: GNAT family N-acetyltransferase [Eubacteriales bacterium]